MTRAGPCSLFPPDRIQHRRADVRLEECDDEGSMVVGHAARGAAGRVGGCACVRFVRTGRRPVRFRQRHTRQERLLKQVAGHDRSCPFLCLD
ncbi:hypothetical protein BCEP4_1810009 [Burkholderia cepacia]|nr:hypothetical protein BCEP4_1810009 [Burkholderia cepacia]